MENQPYETVEPAQLEQSQDIVDLHHRQNNALSVTLWWVRGTMNTFVTVEDGKQSGNFSFDVPHPSMALDCFYHPMVYRAESGKRRPLVAVEGEK